MSRGRPLVAVLRLVAAESPRGLAGLAGLVVLGTALSGGYTVAVSVLLGAVASGQRAAVWPAMAAVAATYLARLAVQPAMTGLATVLGRRVTARTAQLVVDGVLRPVGIAHLHDPGIAGHIAQARGSDNNGLPAGRAVSAMTAVATARLGGLTAVGLLASVLWWAPLPLVAAWLVAGRHLRGQMSRVAEATGERNTELRRAGYLRRLALEAPAAHEVRLFGLAGWLADGFVTRWTAGTAELGGRRLGRTDLLVLTGLAGAHVLVLGVIAHQGASGTLGVAAVTLAAQAVLGTSSLGWLGDLEWQAVKAATAVPAALTVAALPTTPPPATTGPVAPAGAGPLPCREIAFHGVHFGYPDRAVLAGVDLVLPAGRSIALVGDNGVGKTTLVSLLARLYEPDRGRITVDGHDLATLDPARWRRRLAVVTQHPQRLDLPARDNVGIGRPDAPRGDADLAPALRRAGAHEVFAGLPAGWDTVLGRGYTGAHQLSGGQWQRLALARAMFAVQHGATVLVLDEPTAHLDVRAEQELYERFLELTDGLTTVLISHRFATVRMADQVCVLHDGRVAEAGSHDHLLAAGGRYAAAFHLRSRRLLGA